MLASNNAAKSDLANLSLLYLPAEYWVYRCVPPPDLGSTGD